MKIRSSQLVESGWITHMIQTKEPVFVTYYNRPMFVILEIAEYEAMREKVVRMAENG